MLEINHLAVISRLLPFSAKVKRGDRVHIIGPNGAGKSSLLAAIAGMLKAEGEVVIAGNRITELSGRELSRYRSYLCQQYLPLSAMPVYQYLSLHQIAGSSAEAVDKTLTQLCNLLHLNDKLAHKITQLSGGEWQRVRLVATLLQVWPSVNPQGCLLLLDEPANSLDIAHQQALDLIINEFCSEGGIAIISDHDLNHTLQHACRVWMLSQGEVIANGLTAEVMQPEPLSLNYGVFFKLHHFEGRSWIMTV
ncbi:vitamin B12 ABC transporter ATP-binding protein BtuD [Serratia sp. M24T3]|uniref:vitamin B12 ABC transporter ATP-binding protein BtuD n=1 Tax=Serratia sp. M24T3 TaxID=932213 RepID=UPI00025B92FE|nr:vitamin B12 ABC transporter ATP-binding protein BtuD [Serratia sp. M24T3]EIC85475.1 vitamin B12-transporter ATPase [Serratia sp. M24T3]